MTTLTISHYIYLTREQRYALHERNQVETIGISVPVWFDRGTTSEPAQELFCKYILTNELENKVIIPTDEGYKINLPQVPPAEFLLDIDTSEKLLDVQDGGSEWLEFRQLNQIKKGRSHFNVAHFIEIKPEEMLTTTLC